MRRKEHQSDSRRQTPHSVLIVDDEEIVRRGLAAIISAEPDFCVCGLASDEAAEVKLLERHQVHLLLLDLSLGHRDGLQFLKDIASRFTGMLIIALSDHGDEFYVTRALRAGASDYLTKRASATQLISVIRAVLAGERLSHSSRRPARQKVAQASAKTPDRGIVSLTDRELHVFRLIGMGLGTGRIAQELRLSRKTIETYREHIKLKLGYSNAEALRKGALNWAAHSQERSPGARKIRETPDRQA